MSSVLLINLFDKAKVLIIKANEKLQRKEGTVQLRINDSTKSSITKSNHLNLLKK